MAKISVWDGLEFKLIEKDEAATLVKQDKAEYTHLNYSKLRYRNQFTGYKAVAYETREMRSKPVEKITEYVADVVEATEDKIEEYVKPTKSKKAKRKKNSE